MDDLKYMEHIIQCSETVSLCLGCQSCNLVCSIVHEGKTGPCLGRIKMAETDYKHLLFKVLPCMQCDDHPCYTACPKIGSAMKIDEKNIVYIEEDNCIGCRRCMKACRFTPSRINYDPKTRKAKKCDLCRSRENGPACIEYCPVNCLSLGTKEKE